MIFCLKLHENETKLEQEGPSLTPPLGSANENKISDEKVVAHLKQRPLAGIRSYQQCVMSILRYFVERSEW